MEFVAFAIYAAIAVLMFYPAFDRMLSMVPGSAPFAYGNLWSFWWPYYALITHSNLFQTFMVFYPVGVNISVQPISPLLSLLFVPFSFVSIAFAYNFALLAGIAISSFSMFYVAAKLTRNNYASFIAGLIYGFGAYHIAAIFTNVSMVFTAFIPLFAYFMIESFGQKPVKNSALMLISLLLAALIGSIAQAIMLLALFALFFAVQAINLIIEKRQKKSVKNLLIPATFAIAGALLLFAAYYPIFGAYVKEAQLQEISSADLMSFFVPGYYNGIFSALTGHFVAYQVLPEFKSTYIGYVALALSAIAVIRQRRNKIVLVFLSLALIFFWLSLGPYVQINGSTTKVYGIYAVYSIIPYFNVLQEPSSFSVMLSLSIALLSAYGFVELEKMVGKNRNVLFALFFSIAALLLLGNNGFQFGSAVGSQYTNVTIPSVYKIISTLKGNFSVLQLPTIAAAGSLKSAAIASRNTFYSSIMRKPIVGGYLQDEDNLTLESVYSIPLAVESSNLAYFNTFSFSSPVYQNFTNQTLLTLYNYDTALVVVDKSAYNQSQLVGLTSYLISIFGAPVHNGPNTIAFETSNAINNSIYRSFVAYPSILQWKPVYSMVNATQLQVWVPSVSKGNVLYGTVTVYAPYKEGNIQSLIESGARQSINTTIGFYAFSTTQSRIAVGMLSGGKTIILGTFNTTSKMDHYKLNTTLLSGPYGNVLFFMTPASAPSAIRNITFSGG
ncbi:MAG: hypothetical protein ACP5FR_00155 [Candidatus Micrarchaeia archaeon]